MTIKQCLCAALAFCAGLLLMARDQRKGKYLAVIVCELKRREAYS